MRPRLLPFATLTASSPLLHSSRQVRYTLSRPDHGKSRDLPRPVILALRPPMPHIHRRPRPHPPTPRPATANWQLTTVSAIEPIAALAQRLTFFTQAGHYSCPFPPSFPVVLQFATHRYTQSTIFHIHAQHGHPANPLLGASAKRNYRYRSPIPQTRNPTPLTSRLSRGTAQRGGTAHVP